MLNEYWNWGKWRWVDNEEKTSIKGVVNGLKSSCFFERFLSGNENYFLGF